MWPEYYVNKKIQITPSGVETTTFRFAVQYLKQLQNRMSQATAALT